MKVIRKNILIILILLIAGTFLVLNNQTTIEAASIKPALATAINTCDGITEKATAHLVAVVAFQALEIAGRKAAVFKTCMKDHGYRENPKWAKQISPSVKENVRSQNISVDEAAENLRRIDMMSLNLVDDKPVFWLEK